MAASIMKTKVEIPFKRRTSGAIPVKRDINLAIVGQKKLNIRLAVPGIVLILAAALLFSKVAVVDRLMAVSEAERQVAVVQAAVNEGYAQIDSFGALKTTYAHYTYSDMTEEELSRADRKEVMLLLDRYVLSQAPVSNWSLTDNTLQLSISGITLQQVNLIVEQLETDSLVDFCTVTTATTGATAVDRYVNENQEVTATVTAFLNSPAAQQEAEAEGGESE